MRKLESDIAAKDKYVAYCIKKYQPFKFIETMFNDDPDFGNCEFKSNFPVREGQFKGLLFWGHHITSSTNFMPHGYCITYDRSQRTVHIGTYKAGQEFG